MELSGFSHQNQSFVLLINVKMPTIVGILTFMSRINFMLGWAENEGSFVTSGPSVHVSGTKMSYMLLLVLFSILSFGFLFFHVHHLCMPMLGPELVNKILVSCILYHTSGHVLTLKQTMIRPFIPDSYSFYRVSLIRVHASRCGS